MGEKTGSKLEIDYVAAISADAPRLVARTAGKVRPLKKNDVIDNVAIRKDRHNTNEMVLEVSCLSALPRPRAFRALAISAMPLSMISSWLAIASARAASPELAVVPTAAAAADAPPPEAILSGKKGLAQ